MFSKTYKIPVIKTQNISINTLHKGDDDDDDDDDNNNNNNLFSATVLSPGGSGYFKRILHKITKEAQSVDTAIPNCHNLHSAIIQRLQKTQEVERRAYKNMATENDLYNLMFIGPCIILIVE